jgi:GT2 family glycosyltransferase
MKECVEIIVVDNNSSKNVVDYLLNLEKAGTINKLIKNKVNYGFTYAVNQGIDLSNPENDILILNNDAKLTPGALNTLQKTAHKNDDCGITVPQQILPQGKKTIKIHVPYATPERECDFNISAEHDNIVNVPTFHNGEILELSFAPFFCTYIKREVFKKMSLDPELGRHYRSDRIFSHYMRHMLNLKIYYTPEAIVYHQSQKATDLLRQNKREFETMFVKNQWPPELADKLGYTKAIWDN